MFFAEEKFCEEKIGRKVQHILHALQFMFISYSLNEFPI